MAVDFVDSVIIRLADPASREGLLDDDALESLVRTTVDTDAMTVSGPYTPLFDDLQLGRPAASSSIVDGEWRGAGGTTRTEVQLRLHGLGHQPPVRIDALWRGAVVARTSTSRDTIDAVQLDRVADAPTSGTLRLRYSPPSAPRLGTTILPVAVVVLVREAGTSVAALLSESHLARSAAAELGVVAPEDPSVPRRRHTSVLWLLPATVFDDADWPGGGSGSAAARRRDRAHRAATWLATEGIALGLVG